MVTAERPKQCPRDATLSKARLTPALEMPDPFFEMYQSIQSQYRELFNDVSPTNNPPQHLPLKSRDVEGQCFRAVRYAMTELEKQYGVDRCDLYPHQMSVLLNEVGLSNQSGGHVVLYVANGSRYQRSDSDYDIFFDPTSAQFSGKSRGTPACPKSILYQSLAKHGEDLGREMVLDLHLRGYVKIPWSPIGLEKLRLLLGGYSATAWHDNVLVDQPTLEALRRPTEHRLFDLPSDGSHKLKTGLGAPTIEVQDSKNPKYRISYKGASRNRP